MDLHQHGEAIADRILWSQDIEEKAVFGSSAVEGRIIAPVRCSLDACWISLDSGLDN